MRKTFAGLAMAGLLTLGFGSAALAQDSAQQAQTEAETSDDDGGKWGLLGLLGLGGLAGLAGLKRRDRAQYDARSTVPTVNR
jgi:MYXO-CTERM domain-containing protein